MAPTKPTKIDVEALRTQLNALKQVQSAMADAGPADPSQLAALGGLYNDLITSDGKGIQEPVLVQNVDDRYSDCTTWITSAHSSLVDGVNTIVTLLQNTIDQHSKADQNATLGANSTGTGSGSSGGNSTSTSTASRTGN